MKYIKKTIPAALVIFIVGGMLSYINKEPITVLSNELSQLYASYKKEPTVVKLEKIHQAEDCVRAHIAQHGFEVQVNTTTQEQLQVLDTINQYKVVAKLVDGEFVKIYERSYNGMFIILTSEGIKGYLLHNDFSPSIHSFPLKVLVAKTPALSPNKTTKDTLPVDGIAARENKLHQVSNTSQKKLVSNKERGAIERAIESSPKPAPVDNKCKKVHCVALTQRGSRCKRKTTYCNERCFQHQ